MQILVASAINLVMMPFCSKFGPTCCNVSNAFDLLCRCNDFNLVLEMDRILRPEGWAIFRDRVTTLGKVEEILQSLHWKVVLSYTKENEQLLVAQKTFWRPEGTSR